MNKVVIEVPITDELLEDDLAEEIVAALVREALAKTLDAEDEGGG